MDNKITTFENTALGKIRVAGTPDEPFFCLSDICKILDLQVTPTKNRLQQKGVTLINTLTAGGSQSLLYVSEQNLYKVIMRSDKPQAEAFQDWVCGDVLPSIRKHGAYMTPDVIEKTLTDPDFLIRLATELKNEKQARALAEKKIENQQKQLDRQKPKVDFYDKVTESKDTIDMKEVAKILNIPNMGRNNLFEILRMKHILDKNNQPYQKYVDAGYFKIVENKYEDIQGIRLCLKTVVFQKGLDYIRKIMTAHNNDMKIEQLSLNI